MDSILADEGRIVLQDIEQRLCEIDAACSRLFCNKHTSRLASKDLLAWVDSLKLRLLSTGLIVSGGVFSSQTDKQWAMSAGEDVRVTLDCSLNPNNLSLHSGFISDTVSDFQALVVPCHAARFEVADAEWAPGQKTVKAIVDIKKGELIGEYQGYYVHCNQASNERYNATVGGSSGYLTCDPCLGYEDPLLEWTNSVTHRINEPPMGSKLNCMWKIRKGLSPQIFAASDIAADQELFIFYGEGHAPLRDYPIASDLTWLETPDSYNSD